MLDLQESGAVRWPANGLSHWTSDSGLQLRITLNGEPFDIDQPLSVTELLNRLAIDPRRVAVEHNLRILKRDAFEATTVEDGDRVEIVNFVGGGHGDVP